MGRGAYFAPAGDPARDFTRTLRLLAWAGGAFGCFGLRGSRLPVRFFLDMCLSRPAAGARLRTALAGASTRRATGLMIMEREMLRRREHS